MTRDYIKGPTCLDDMARGLEGCPSEIIEQIVVRLDLKHICSLRLSCRSLAAKCVQTYFKKFFRSIHIDLTKDALQTFANGTQAGGLGCLFQELTITGIARQRKERISRMHNHAKQEEITLLTQAFNRLAFHRVATIKSNDLGPLSLSLRVAVVSDTGERILPIDAPGALAHKRIWPATADTFETVMRALAASRLPIAGLNVFNHPTLQQCSLACDELDKINWNDPGFPKAFAPLRSLSISLSNRLLEIYEHEDECEGASAADWLSLPKRNEHIVRAEAEADTNFVGLSRLFRLLSHLDNLELHYLRIEPFHITGGYDHTRLLHCLAAETDRLPKIKSCRLRGLATREADLLAFLKWTGVRELHMEHVCLYWGTFRSIFDYCTSERANMTRLWFDDLSEGKRVHFIGADGWSRWDGWVPEYGAEMLEREGDEVKQPISYEFRIIPLMGFPAYTDWLNHLRLEYG